MTNFCPYPFTILTIKTVATNLIKRRECEIIYICIIVDIPSPQFPPVLSMRKSVNILLLSAAKWINVA